MKCRTTIGLMFVAFFSCVAAGAEAQDAELLLSGGTLYSLAQRSYKSLHLPIGWSIVAAHYSPDNRLLAIVVKGIEVPPPAVLPTVRLEKPHVPIPMGPIHKIIRNWKPSTHLLLIDRTAGSVLRTWPLPSSGAVGDWAMTWTGTEIQASARLSTATIVTDLFYTIDVVSKTGVKFKSAAPPAVPPDLSKSCNGPWAETQFQGKKLRFTKEAAICSTPPETSDVYRLVHPHEAPAKDEILWEYRVLTDQTACTEPYACYMGTDAQFLSLGDARYLVWDGDLFALHETDDGIKAQLITQLLPQFSHPLGITAKETHLNALDWEPAMPFQPVSEGLRIGHGENPVLYAQNFLPTRSFNATVEVGDYKKNVMVPAGTQVGPIDIGSFKDRAYTPLLSTLRWTSFHHLADPVYCQSPYTISANTAGMIVSITQDPKGNLQCGIRFQEDR